MSRLLLAVFRLNFDRDLLATSLTSSLLKRALVSGNKKHSWLLSITAARVWGQIPEFYHNNYVQFIETSFQETSEMNPLLFQRTV